MWLVPRWDMFQWYAVPEQKKPELKNLVETSVVRAGRPSVPAAIELWDYMCSRWEIPKHGAIHGDCKQIVPPRTMDHMTLADWDAYVPTL